MQASPRCPRDEQPLEVVHRVDGKLEVDVCRTCGGVWLDSHELAELCPTASHFGDRREEVLLTELARSDDGRLSASMLRCPKCAAGEGTAPPVEILVAQAKLDFCTECGGIWLDAEEAAALVRDPPREAGTVRAAATPFRQAATDLAAIGKTRCSSCRNAVDASELFAQRDGFICRVCWADTHQAEANRRAREGFAAGLAGAVIALVQIPIDEIVSAWDTLTDKRPKGWR